MGRDLLEVGVRPRLSGKWGYWKTMKFIVLFLILLPGYLFSQEKLDIKAAFKIDSMLNSKNPTQFFWYNTVNVKNLFEEDTIIFQSNSANIQNRKDSCQLSRLQFNSKKLLWVTFVNYCDSPATHWFNDLCSSYKYKLNSIKPDIFCVKNKCGARSDYKLIKQYLLVGSAETIETTMLVLVKIKD